MRERDTLRSVFARGEPAFWRIPNASIRLQAREDSVPQSLTCFFHPPVGASLSPRSSHPTRQQDAYASLIPPRKKAKIDTVQLSPALHLHQKKYKQKIQQPFHAMQKRKHTIPPENPGTEARDPHMTARFAGAFRPRIPDPIFLWPFWD